MARASASRRPGRLKQLLERMVLGTLMTIGVATIERRLRKAARKRGAG